jgi:hypothetical protein
MEFHFKNDLSLEKDEKKYNGSIPRLLIIDPLDQ